MPLIELPVKEIERQKQVESEIAEGKKAFDTKDYVKAFTVLDKHKDNKAFDSEAQRELGWMYREAKGVTQNYPEALKWYQKAVEQGHPAAQGGLGHMYDEGKGVKQDKKEAVKWYKAEGWI